MESMVDLVVAKYMRPPQATEFMEYLLRLALYDLEEVWADECAGLRARVWTLEGNMQTQQGVMRAQEAANQDLVLQIDALDAENVRLKEQVQELSTAVKRDKTRDELLRLYNTEAP